MRYVTVSFEFEAKDICLPIIIEAQISNEEDVEIYSGEVSIDYEGHDFLDACWFRHLPEAEKEFIALVDRDPSKALDLVMEMYNEEITDLIINEMKSMEGWF